MSNNNHKKIHDLALSAFLSSIGHELKGMESDGGRGVFIFENSPNFEEDTLRFFNRKGMVDALTYAESLRNLKAMIKNRM